MVTEAEECSLDEYEQAVHRALAAFVPKVSGREVLEESRESVGDDGESRSVTYFSSKVYMGIHMLAL